MTVSFVPGVLVLVVLPVSHCPVGSAVWGRSSVSVWNVSEPVLLASSVLSVVSVHHMRMSDTSLAS